MKDGLWIRQWPIYKLKKIRQVWMPWITFMANGLWVLVIGLMGPSVPFIINEFSIDYSQAGLIFTLLSIASFLGTFAGGWISDYRYRKFFWMLFLVMLTAGLVFFGFAASFSMILVIVFVMSLFGSPIGAVGQSIMLQMFPEKRSSYLSLSTMFAAVGSFLAPILISLACLTGFGWRGAFYAAALIALVLFTLVSFSGLPKPPVHQGGALSVFRLFGDRRVLFAGIMIFLSVGLDLGFSYWLAEYFVSKVGTAAEFSGFAVGCYLAGVISGRFANSRKPLSIGYGKLCGTGLVLAAVWLVLFLNVELVSMKLVFCFLYGLCIAPTFPSMMAVGTGFYPKRSGAVTAVLFSMMSLSGAVFPVVIGSIGQVMGIEKAYYALILIMVPVLAGLLFSGKLTRQPS